MIPSYSFKSRPCPGVTCIESISVVLQGNDELVESESGIEMSLGFRPLGSTQPLLGCKILPVRTEILWKPDQIGAL